MYGFCPSLDKIMIESKDIQVVQAEMKDLPVVQNMGRFYLYDVSRYCGSGTGWEIPNDGLYECFSFRHYFLEPTCYPYLIKVKGELAGFVMVDQDGVTDDITFCIAEFFILAKFQGRGVGKVAVQTLWAQSPGRWEVRVLPDNTPALTFWRGVIQSTVEKAYKEEDKMVERPHRQRKIVFTFDIKEK